MTTLPSLLPAAAPPERPPRALWPTARAWLLALVFVGLQAVILVAPLIPSGKFTLEANDPAPQDFRAPYTKTYVSRIRTTEARNKAAAAVGTVYTPADTAIARQRVQRAQQILGFLDSIRADPYATPEQALAWIAAIPDVDFPPQAARQVLALSSSDWTQRVRPEILTVLDQAMRSPIRDDTLAQARSDVVRRVSLGLSEEAAGLVISIVQAFLVPNSTRDEVATAAARTAAAQTVADVEVTYARGDLLVAQGQRVSATDVEALDQFGFRQARTDPLTYLSTTLIVALVTALLGLYVQRFHASFWTDVRYLAVLGLLFTVWVLGAKLSIPGRVVLPYLFPSAALAMLLAVLLEPNLAIVAAAMFSMVVGYVSGGSLELVVFSLAGSLVAALTLRRVERISTFFWAGIFVGVANVVVVLAFRLSAGNSTDALVALFQLVSAGLANGLISAGLSLAGFFVLGSVFDILTTIQLQELARPNHPLLQKILREAPGSYHHSLLVGNLAEQAAERIGADAMLVRVGAFYHDVGKTVRPYLFIENQMEGGNVHEQLDAHTSAAMLVRHVREGVDLAKRYRLPRRVRAFIPEHHGTMRVSFLYQKALEAAEDPAQINEADFRYPGPKPQTRETALLMLADGCEAAVRSIRPSSVEEVEQIVRRVINERAADGQLDDCNLTLRDLALVTASFVATLKGVFHPRIKYPEPPAAHAAPAPARPPIADEGEEDLP